jgi:hypothetical protein
VASLRELTTIVNGGLSNGKWPALPVSRSLLFPWSACFTQACVNSLARCYRWKNTGKKGEANSSTAEEEHPEERPGRVYRSSEHSCRLESDTRRTTFGIRVLSAKWREHSKLRAIGRQVAANGAGVLCRPRIPLEYRSGGVSDPTPGPGGWFKPRPPGGRSRPGCRCRCERAGARHCS